MNWTLGNISRLRRKSFIGQLVLLALAVELLFFASFTSLELPTATQRNIERCINLTAQRLLVYLPERYHKRVLYEFPVLREQVPAIRYSQYVPLMPVAVFVGYVLGAPLAALAAALYLVLGLVGPYINVLAFAAGGGLTYYRQPGFGYLLGLIGGAWIAGRITSNTVTSLRQVLSIVLGLLCVHGVGLLYLVGGALAIRLFGGEVASLRWQPWLFETIRNLSWYPLPYDALFSLALVGAGFPFRWLTAVLTAPDIGMRPKTNWESKLETSEAEAAVGV